MNDEMIIESLEKLQKERKELIKQRDNINKRLIQIDDILSKVNKLFDDYPDDKASGTEIFLWGLSKTGGEGTVADVFNVVNELKHLNNISKRDNPKLKQWLTVSANALVRSGKLVRLERKDRKGGVRYGYLDL